MKLNPYLTFNGDCEAAFRFYEQHLGGKIQVILPFGETPACGEIPKEWHDKVMHACLVIGDNLLMGSDNPPGMQEEKQGYSVAINVDEPAEAERIFGALAEGGTVRMPLEQTFWAIRFGMVVDRFGISWMVNCADEQYARQLADRSAVA